VGESDGMGSAGVELVSGDQLHKVEASQARGQGTESETMWSDNREFDQVLVDRDEA